MFVADLTFENNSPRLEKYTMLDSPDKERIEKNWTSIVWNDRVVAMYSLHPLVLADVDGVAVSSNSIIAVTCIQMSGMSYLDHCEGRLRLLT